MRNERRVMFGNVADRQNARTANNNTVHCYLFTVTCSLLLVICYLLSGCITWGAASAEEYFAIGMAYYDMGQNGSAANRERYFQEAEKWLLRARAKDKTKSASEYNLGRIAFETGRYEESAKHFESILKRDPDNVLALRAAAYMRIRNGEIEKAAELYDRLLALVPESADDGYNHALVLFAMEKYAEAEQVLQSNEFALLDNNDVLLLYARTQKEQGKPEAIDTYAKWLISNTDLSVRYEYGQLLEENELYARALDEYRLVQSGLSGGSVNPSKPELRFAIARVLLIADPGNTEGMSELKGSVEDGFSDSDKMQALLADGRISAANREEIRTIVADMRRLAAAVSDAASEADDNDSEAGDNEEEDEW